MRDLLSFPDASRVWVYQADRSFPDEQIQMLNQDIADFCIQWTSHNNALRATGGVLHDRFVVLIVDETQAPASGCSIDKSVAFIKNLELKYGCRLLQRDQIAWLDENQQVRVIPLSDLKDALNKGLVTLKTKMFDNLVTTRKDFINRWTVALEDSWMKKFT